MEATEPEATQTHQEAGAEAEDVAVEHVSGASLRRAMVEPERAGGDRAAASPRTRRPAAPLPWSRGVRDFFPLPRFSEAPFFPAVAARLESGGDAGLSITFATAMGRSTR